MSGNASNKRQPGMSSGQNRLPTIQQRQAQSKRDKAAHRAMMNRMTAQMRSIPKGAPKKKTELFSQGALKSFQFAPRGHGYYDAFANRPETAVVAATTGPATIVTGHSCDVVAGYGSTVGTYATHEFAASDAGAPSHTGNATLVVFNPGASDDSIACVYKLGLAAPSRLMVERQILSCVQFSEFGPTITNRSTNTGHVDGDTANRDSYPARRIESIPLRGSVRFRNITEALAIGGVVRVMRYNGGLNFNLDSSGVEDNPGSQAVMPFLDVCNMIRDSTRTRVFTGHELREMHQSNCYPADFVRSMAFESDRSIFETVRAPGYCSVLFLIDDYTASHTAVNNSYEFQFLLHRAARFGPGTILHGMATQMQVKPEVHNQGSKLEEARAAAAKAGKSLLTE